MSVRMMSDEGVMKAFEQAVERATMDVESNEQTKDVVNRIREMMPYFLGSEKYGEPKENVGYWKGTDL